MNIMIEILFIESSEKLKPSHRSPRPCVARGMGNHAYLELSAAAVLIAMDGPPSVIVNMTKRYELFNPQMNSFIFSFNRKY